MIAFVFQPSRIEEWIMPTLQSPSQGAAFDALHAVAIGQARWDEVMGFAKEMVGADSATMLWHSKKAHGLAHTETADIPAHTLQLYGDHFHKYDPIALRHWGSPPGTRFSCGLELDKQDSISRSFWNDFMQPCRIQEIHGCILTNEEQWITAISFQRSRLYKPSRETLRTEQAFMALAAQALQEQQRRNIDELSHLGQLLGPRQNLWMILNSRGELLSNVHALFQELDHDHSLQLVDNHLRHQDPRWNQRLLDALQDCQQTHRPLQLHLPDNWGRSYRLYLGPADARYSQGLQNTLQLRLECRHIFHLPSAELIAEFFSLTPTEAQLCHCLASGMTLKDVALVLGMASETARKHLASVMKKTGCHRQPELLRLITSL